MRPRALLVIAVLALGGLGVSLGNLAAASLTPEVPDLVRAAQSGATARENLADAAASLDLAASLAIDGAPSRAKAAAIRAALAETGRDETRVAWLDAAIADLEASLSSAPVQPVQWARLALFRFARDGGTLDPAGRTLAALTQSFLLGPHEMDAWMPRLRVALTAWDDMPQELRRATSAQLRAALRWYKHEPLAAFWRTASPVIKQHMIVLLNERPGEALLFWAELAKEP